TVDEWRDLIRRVCTDSLMIPMDKTRAELSVDAGEPSAAGRHTDIFAPRLACGQDGFDSPYRVGRL
ncbi:hypothetical protein KI387_040759, partial [Taxus chinensis]